jgi:large subunit ribosomal protein L17
MVLYEKIITTAAKAKELRRVAERLVTLAKRGDLHARRQAAEVLNDEKALQKLFSSVGIRYQERNGGYTRITKLDYRMGDGAPLAAIEFVGAEAAPETKKAKPKTKGGPADSAEAGGTRRRRRRRKTAAPAEAGSAAGAEG